MNQQGYWRDVRTLDPCYDASIELLVCDVTLGLEGSEKGFPKLNSMLWECKEDQCPTS